MPILTTRERDRVAAHALAEYVASLPASPARDIWHTALLAALGSPATGTLRAWMEDHDGASVHTLQATVSMDATGENVGVRSAWQPGERAISATRAGAVTLGDSSRDYAGCRVIAASDESLVIAATCGDDRQIVFYLTPRALERGE